MAEIATQLNFEYWLLQTLAMLLTALFLPNFKVSGPIPALLAVVALAFVNAHVWDAALFFQIPDALTYKAMTILFSNAILFWLIVKLLPGIEIRGLLAPLAAPILFTVLSLVISRYGSEIDWGKAYTTVMESISARKTELKAMP